MINNLKKMLSETIGVALNELCAKLRSKPVTEQDAADVVSAIEKLREINPMRTRGLIVMALEDDPRGAKLTMAMHGDAKAVEALAKLLETEMKLQELGIGSALEAAPDADGINADGECMCPGCQFERALQGEGVSVQVINIDGDLLPEAIRQAMERKEVDSKLKH